MYADDTTLVSHLENFGPVNDTNTLEQELNKGNIKGEYMATE